MVATTADTGGPDSTPGPMSVVAGIELRTEELARIGRLLRDHGQWRGRQLVSSAWIDRMQTDEVQTGADGAYTRYGLAVWAGPGDCWRLDGRYGQYVVVDEARNAVVTVTAYEESRDLLLAEAAATAIDEGVGHSVARSRISYAPGTLKG